MKWYKKIGASILSLTMLLSGCNSQDPIKGNINDVKLEAGDMYAVINIMDYGDITVKLFPDVAPKAVLQFVTLAERGYYDGKNIHRVLPNLLIQGGSLKGNGRDGEINAEEYIELETNDNARHFYGAICMANSYDASGEVLGNYCQFYIVNNNKSVDIDDTIANLESQLSQEGLSESDKTYYNEYVTKLKSISEAAKEKYLKTGGDFHLDGEDTVFGQTIDGFDVIDKISQIELVSGNTADDALGTPSKPIDPITIESVNIIKVALPETTTTTEAPKTKKTTTASDVQVMPGIDTITEVTTVPSESISEETPETATVEENEAEITTINSEDTSEATEETSVESIEETDETVETENEEINEISTENDINEIPEDDELEEEPTIDDELEEETNESEESSQQLVDGA